MAKEYRRATKARDEFTEAREKFSAHLSGLIDQDPRNHFQIATAIGVRESTLSRWVRGLAVPQIDRIVKIADTLGVTVDDLLRPAVETPGRSRPVPVTETVLPPAKPERSAGERRRSQDRRAAG